MRSLRSSIVPLCAALVAAVCAHWAIDVAGDYLLPRDAFDGMAHGSRPIFAGAAALLVAVILCAGVRGALREARGREAAFCDALRALAPAGPFAFCASVVVATFAFVAAMQGLDLRAAGGELDDPADLLGGSLALGGACTLACAMLAAWCARRLIVRLAADRGRIVGAVVAFIRREPRLPGSARRSRRLRARRSHAAVRAGRRRAGRAPPPLPATAS